MENLYRVYSTYLKEKYGSKVYRLPINLPLTCPNRDGSIGFGGCTFCSDVATGFESLENSLTVKEQLEKNKSYIKEKYKAEKFIAYFQNYTNTYMPFEEFKSYIKEALIEDVVEISISTRPDALSIKHLSFLSELKRDKNINITIEMGLQTANYKTLKLINRGHTLAEFIEAMMLVKKFELESCIHVILNLPNDDMQDIIETAKILSAFKIEGVKIHSLYIAKNSPMAKDFLNEDIKMITLDEYVDRVIAFLRYLDPSIVIQRIAGRAPKEFTLFCNWDTSWWKIKDQIEENMKNNGFRQGDLFDYLGAKALKRFK